MEFSILELAEGDGNLDPGDPNLEWGRWDYTPPMMLGPGGEDSPLATYSPMRCPVD
jgi:hypothetical protein